MIFALLLYALGVVVLFGKCRRYAFLWPVSVFFAALDAAEMDLSRFVTGKDNSNG